MKIHFRFDDTNGEHTKTTLFIDGRSVGQLVMSPTEAVWLDRLLSVGVNEVGRYRQGRGIEYITSGSPPGPRDGDATTA